MAGAKLLSKMMARLATPAARARLAAMTDDPIAGLFSRFDDVGKGEGRAVMTMTAADEAPWLPNSRRWVDWDWADGAPPSSRKEIAATFDDAASKAEKAIRSNFPREYTIEPMTPAHGRRFRRDLMERLHRSGYEESDGYLDALSIKPTEKAYIDYLLRKLGIVGAGAAAGAAAAGMSDER